MKLFVYRLLRDTSHNTTSFWHSLEKLFSRSTSSDVKRGPNLEAEAEAEARTMRSRPRPVSKIIMKKYQMMINNIWFKIIEGKINKIPEFYTIFVWKMPDYIIRKRNRGQAEAKT